MTIKPTTPGWYPDPSGAPGNRYFDGIDWTDVTVAAPPIPQPTTSGGIGRSTAVAIGVCVLSGIGLLMSMQPTSLLAGTGTIWTGVGLTAAGMAVAFVCGAEKWVRSLAVVALILAALSAGYMEQQLAEKRDEISRIFNP